MKKVLSEICVYFLAVILSIGIALLTLFLLINPFSDIVKVGTDAIFGNAIDNINIIEFDSSVTEKKAQIINDLDDENENGGYISYVRLEDMEFPSYGDNYGTIQTDTTGINCKLFMGDSAKILRHGAGTFYGSHIPGDGGTVLIAAHCTTFFRPLETTQVGEKIKITTTYGDYLYEVIDTRIAPATSTDTYDLGADYENLILYTCYPLDTLKARKDRFFVYAKLVSGTKIERRPMK